MTIEKAIEVARNILNTHPYFTDGEIKQVSESDWELVSYESKGVNNIIWAITFTPKNGDRVGGCFEICISQEEQKYTVTIIQNHPSYWASVIFKETMNVESIYNNMVTFFFISLNQDFVYLYKQGNRTSRFPHEWKKSYNKAIKKYTPMFYSILDGLKPRYSTFGKKNKQPEFYPVGTEVQVEDRLDVSNRVIVKGIVVVEPDSYAIRTGEPLTVGTHGWERVINTTSVVKIISRGKGKTFRLFGAQHKLFIEAPVRTPAEEQQQLEKELFQKIKSSKQTWETNSLLDRFITQYILCYYKGILPINFEYQFDVFRFIREVSVTEETVVEGRRSWNFVIDKKKFKKQLKRINCYLFKLSKVVQEAREDDEIYYKFIS